jgi:hypothetical protein
MPYHLATPAHITPYLAKKIDTGIFGTIFGGSEMLST